MKTISKSVVAASVLAIATLLSACGESDHSVVSLGDLIVNGAGRDGSVPAGKKQFYAAKYIKATEKYTVRSQIVSMPSDTTGGPVQADGTLSVAVYASQSAYLNNESPVKTAVPAGTNFPYIFEAHFTAPSDGDYLIVISGASLTNSDKQFFYDLRIMSATTELSSFSTSTNPPELAFDTQVLFSGDISVYSGASLTSSGTYTIRLTSQATTTSGYPHLFVYGDDRLTIESLLFSSISTSAGFTIREFSNGVLVNTTSNAPDNIKSDVSFSASGPFFLVRGVSGAEYTLTVSP